MGLLARGGHQGTRGGLGSGEQGGQIGQLLAQRVERLHLEQQRRSNRVYFVSMSPPEVIAQTR